MRVRIPITPAVVWRLHIWVGRENSSGMFAPWNTKVTVLALSA
jgi:hypothetical protein